MKKILIVFSLITFIKTNLFSQLRPEEYFSFFRYKSGSGIGQNYYDLKGQVPRNIFSKGIFKDVFPENGKKVVYLLNETVNECLVIYFSEINNKNIISLYFDNNDQLNNYKRYFTKNNIFIEGENFTNGVNRLYQKIYDQNVPIGTIELFSNLHSLTFSPYSTKYRNVLDYKYKITFISGDIW